MGSHAERDLVSGFTEDMSGVHRSIVRSSRTLDEMMRAPGVINRTKSWYLQGAIRSPLINSFFLMDRSGPWSIFGMRLLSRLLAVCQDGVGTSLLESMLAFNQDIL